MIATLLQLPAWFVSPDDKPSYQVFNNYLDLIESNQMFKAECQTISTPTLSELVIQIGNIVWVSLINFNYVKWNNQYYIIQDINYVSANNNVVQIHGQIDLYLSFLVRFFDENNNVLTTPVYFNQKHLNRYQYQLSNNVVSGYTINPATQFYLLNKHEQLGNVGSKQDKHVYTVNDFTYITSNNHPFANDNYFDANQAVDLQGSITPQAYPVVLWQQTANSTFVTNPTSNNTSTYPFPYALGSIGLPTSVIGSSQNTSPFQSYFFLSSSADLGSEYYADVYLFPLSLNYLVNQNNNGTLTSNSSTVFEFTGWQYTTNSSNLAAGYNSTADPVLLLSPTNHLYAFVQSLANSTTYPSTLLLLNDEPALINYANFNARIYGQDSHIDISSFVLTAGVDANPSMNWLDMLLTYLGSFCITISPPNMMLTNIPFNTYTANANALWNFTGTLWNYNNYNDVIYSCQLKATAPSASTNWADYMAENKKSYDMSLNVSQLLAQNAQANVKIAQAKYGAAISSFDNIGADLLSIFTGSFGNKVASTYADSIGANTLAPNDAAIQQDKLNYLKTGMKADYTRTSNMRTSAISTINTLYDSTFCLVFEFPPVYEQLAVINYYALFGYKIERWLPFNYWLNRKYCNYVKITNFTNAMLPNLNAYYRAAIDGLLNKGVRIWNNASFNNDDYGQVPYNTVLINSTSTYGNTELNQNNNELDYLINNG